MALKTGISGLRGTVTGDDAGLTADVVLAYARAFATHLTDGAATATVVLGRDSRRSSPMLADLVRGALLSAGCRVCDLGLTLTPTVQFAVAREARAVGGVMITASHNPTVWNGLKFLDANGRFLPTETWEALHAIIDAGTYRDVGLDAVATIHKRGAEAFTAHRDVVLAALPAEQIRAAHLRVALDACNGGAVRWQELFEMLGCEVIACHTEQHGFFAREAEPLPAHLDTLRRLVRETGCDLGFAADPDGDRLALVDERGKAVSEEHTVVLCAQERLTHERGPVVVNVVTTHAIDEVLDTTVHRTAVGEMNVVDGVLATDAVLGGEGSGGIIVPAINLARDGMAAAGLILSLVATTGRSLSDLVAEIPPWRTVKTRVEPEGADADAIRNLFAAWRTERPDVQIGHDGVTLSSAAGTLYVRTDGPAVTMAGELPDGQRLRGTMQAATVSEILDRLAAGDVALDLIDGVKLSVDTAWISLRPSNTEPIIRLMGEVRASAPTTRS